MSSDNQDTLDQNTTTEPTPIMAIEEMTEIELRQELQDTGVNMHHKTGIGKLQTTLAAVRAGTYTAPEIKSPPAPVKTKPALTGPTAAAIEARDASKVLTKTQRAMLLQRIIVVPNDPLMSAYSGLIFTVGSSSVNNGRMVKKFVPFNNEQGWHVPQIIIDQIEAAEMQKFRPITLPNGQKTQQAYIAKKYNVQILPPLTKGEMKTLAASQQAAKGIVS
jgi:hypothetical protein